MASVTKENHPVAPLQDHNEDYSEYDGDSDLDYDSNSDDDDTKEDSVCGTDDGADMAKKVDGSSEQGDRPVVLTRTSKHSPYYNMNHPHRGYCHIFVYKSYKDKEISDRDSALEDARITYRAFKRLGFSVRIHWHLKTEDFCNTLTAIRKIDHTNCDALAIVMMTHGGNFGGVEYFNTWDGEVRSEELWLPFTGDRCPSLVGKPKMFFVQACRGQSTDTGTAMKVTTDSLSFRKKPKEEVVESFAIPNHADIMVLNACTSDMFAFKTYRGEVNGSVFIHYLTKYLNLEGRQSDLYDIILKTMRSVAIDYQSNCPGQRIDKNKQVPQLVTTLLRKVTFAPKGKSDDVVAL